MNDFANHCFACGKEVDPQTTEKNKQFNLPVCSSCKDTDEEKKAINDLLEGMAEGFVCGCI
jgi:ribosome-binding protein aMBF1 (putative translation factor)